MLKKITFFMISIIICSAIFHTNVFAATKEDIFAFVNAQTVCGDEGVFNSYKKTFTRLLKQKDLTQAELDAIYSYLQNAVGILNSKGVCKIADLNKLTSAEKKAVYNNLMTGANLITKAPTLEDKEEVETPDENTGNSGTSDKEQGGTSNNKKPQTTKPTTNKKDNEGTKITINTQDGTMDIYENGVLVDKLERGTAKMTYTGTNLTYVVIVVGRIAIFFVAFMFFRKLYDVHTSKSRFVKNIFVSLMICSATISLTVIIFGSKIETVLAAVDMLSIANSDEEIMVELNEKNEIVKYPSYGANYGILSIPEVGVENKIYFGDMTAILSFGIGHTTSSSMPTEGDVIIYSGHNRKDMLDGIKDIKKGQEIIVDTTYAKCTYKVVKTEVLKDTETGKLTMQNGKETLILYTCHPFGNYVYTNKRFVVYSVLDNIEWK